MKDRGRLGLKILAEPSSEVVSGGDRHCLFSFRTCMEVWGRLIVDRLRVLRARYPDSGTRGGVREGGGGSVLLRGSAGWGWR